MRWVCFWEERSPGARRFCRHLVPGQVHFSLSGTRFEFLLFEAEQREGAGS
jgi:hypothetical protein